MIITVDLGTRSYPVYLDDPSALDNILQKTFSERKFSVITNKTIENLYAGEIDLWSKKINIIRHSIADGEQYKNIETWSGILDTLLRARLDRSAVIIAFGGGVVGDIAGFASASFLRGVDYVQVPTTLLAMVDSSVGGKTAVNHPMGKNLIGAFYQPRLVWISTKYLDTLPEREFFAGYAEIFKYGFIGGASMFDFILENHDKIIAKEPFALRESIKRSIEIKSAIVSEDELESGKRSLLNFGHTFGHSLEKFYNYSGVLHGEAVYAGIACAVDLGLRIGTIPDRNKKAYTRIMQKIPPVKLPSPPDTAALYDAMFSDKKVKNGKIRFVLPAEPGKSVINKDVPKDAIIATLKSVLIKA